LKRHSAWDVATLARSERAELWELLGEARIRRAWFAHFLGRKVTAFDTPARRFRRAAMAWLGAAGVYAMMLAFWFDTTHREGSGRRIVAMPSVLAVSWMLCLCYSWTYENPALFPTRRRRVRLAAVVVSRSERPDADPADLATFGEEVRARRRAWLDGSTRPRGFNQRTRLMHLYPPAVTLMYAGMSAIPLGMFLNGWQAVMSLLAAAGQWIGIGLGIWLPGRLLARLDRCARELACPDCGYDLASVPGAFALEATAGVPVGPRRCVECGCPWPLVPPPVV
jgi:hypothetical protein